MNAMAEEPICRHCWKPIAYGSGWWEHVGGTVACNPHQATYPPRGTNAAPMHVETNAARHREVGDQGGG